MNDDAQRTNEWANEWMNGVVIEHWVTIGFIGFDRNTLKFHLRTTYTHTHTHIHLKRKSTYGLLTRYSRGWSTIYSFRRSCIYIYSSAIFFFAINNQNYPHMKFSFVFCYRVMCVLIVQIEASTYKTKQKKN